MNVNLSIAAEKKYDLNHFIRKKYSLCMFLLRKCRLFGINLQELLPSKPEPVEAKRGQFDRSNFCNRQKLC